MKFVLRILLFLLTSQVFAQSKEDTSKYLYQPARIEFEIGEKNIWHYVINGRENGLLVAEQTSRQEEDGRVWNLTAVDRDLQKKWEHSVQVPYEYEFLGWAHAGDYYYLFFSTASFSEKDFALFEIESETGYYKETKLSTAFRIDLSEFEVLQRTAILGGETDFKPAVITFDLDENATPRVLPAIYNSDTELLDIKLDRQSGLFAIITSYKTPQKVNTVHVRTYTTDNQVVQENLIKTSNKDLSLISGATTDFLGGFQYVAGTYASRNSSYSRGLYLAKFVGGQQKFLKYLNFADLKNFWAYLPEKKERKYLRKVARKEEKGKDPNFTYRIQVHDMVQLDGQYILIGEAYYRRYVSQPINQFQMINAPRVETEVQHEFTHAIVVGFDQNGELLWDHSFNLDEKTTANLTEFVTVNVLNNRLELLYLDDDVIKSKIVYKEQILESRASTPVRLESAEDELKGVDYPYEDLANWYGETLIAYGRQKIRNKSRIPERRDVFYINKLQYKIDESSN